MKNILSRTAATAGFTACLVVLVTSSGCVTEQRGGYVRSPRIHAQAVVVVQDDYEYYPNYEVYYSRNRHEYVYLDGGSWVRRPQPSGVTLDVLVHSPSVRLDFHDAPELHHSSVVRSYPRNWKHAEKRRDRKDNSREDKNDRNDRRD